MKLIDGTERHPAPGPYDLWYSPVGNAFARYWTGTLTTNPSIYKHRGRAFGVEGITDDRIILGHNSTLKLPANWIDRMTFWLYLDATPNYAGAGTIQLYLSTFDFLGGGNQWAINYPPFSTYSGVSKGWNFIDWKVSEGKITWGGGMPAYSLHTINSWRIYIAASIEGNMSKVIVDDLKFWGRTRFGRVP